MTWLASTDSVKSLSDAVGELRLKVDDATALSEMAIRSSGKVERLGQEMAKLQAHLSDLERDKARVYAIVLERPFLGRLSWLVTGK